MERALEGMALYAFHDEVESVSPFLILQYDTPRTQLDQSSSSLVRSNYGCHVRTGKVGKLDRISEICLKNPRLPVPLPTAQGWPPHQS